ncbi:hypothetical protein H257_09243 [Aphanomyces astaci]|uniref:Transposase Tc1-like domain-containing protein n=1 Tax=Aphanomyces astaci TaxID=112090 RepID=W4GAU3_APHAT|nr:hypothetical protein H257_09243 [Aphanomyces astaci]ETV76790.1 hypothetical protein H257_09243 [Aphanomyces astaci]|eukprot:XP_009833702.1 hypothetical protein H257_09243 [Aphanomyces astaci]
MIVTLSLQAFIKKGKLPRGAYKQAAEQLNMNPRTVGHVWRTFCSRGTTVSNKAGKVGPEPMYSTDRAQQLVQSIPADQRSTFRDMAAATSTTLGTLSRHLKKGTLQRCSTPIKPLLTDANKWFNADKDRRKVYLVPGEMPPWRSWKSKGLIPKVVFLGAVARPPYDEPRGVFFNGKIGMWPFVCLVPAARNSRNQPAGTMVTKLVSVDAAVYRDYVMNKVVPAIKATFPSANKRVVLQYDNATPHVSITDAELASVSTGG